VFRLECSLSFSEVFDNWICCLFTIRGVAAGWAQQDSPAAQQRQPDTTSQTSAMNQVSDAQTFSGKIAKAGGKYILKDTVDKTMYVLDDQDQAKKFEGQEVKVSGTLDAQTKTIHLSSITPAS